MRTIQSLDLGWLLPPVALALLPAHELTTVIRPGEGENAYIIDDKPCSRVTNVLYETIPKNHLYKWQIQMVLASVEAELAKGLLKGSITVAQVPQLLEAARNYPDEIMEAAGQWGTRVHGVLQDCIQATLEGLLVVDVPNDVSPSVEAFKAFSMEHEIRWLATEVTVWDRELAVAGTVDAIGYGPDGYVIADWKTGKRIYPEAALQVSAYAAMVEALYGITVSKAYVVRFPWRCQDCAGEGFTVGATGYKIGCDDCKSTGIMPVCKYEVREVADRERGWQQFQQQVAQGQYLARSPWVRKKRKVEG